MNHSAASTLGTLAALLVLVVPNTAPAGPHKAARTSSAASALLRVSPHSPELEGRPDLVRRLRETPSAYFRFVNRGFTQAVCGEFHDLAVEFPDVNLHGDAHVEQYAITSLGRGLTDFDESARGPSFIDLVRFGVSLGLAANENGWPGEGRRAFGAFLGGYRTALTDPNTAETEPSIVTRVRGTFAGDHGAALRHAEAVIDADPVPASEIAAAMKTYIAAFTDRMEVPASFFTIKKAGRSNLGIGSALDEKYVLRIEGWSRQTNDDEILESKLVRPLSDTGCIRSDQGPERVPLGMALIAYHPFPFSGLYADRGRTFWVHAWTDDYVELSIDSSFASPQDLRQVAYDAGLQLGRAHPKDPEGNASRADVRAILVQATFRNEIRVRQAIESLTEATMAAWRAFREAAAPRSSNSF